MPTLRRSSLLRRLESVILGLFGLLWVTNTTSCVVDSDSPKVKYGCLSISCDNDPDDTISVKYGAPEPIDTITAKYGTPPPTDTLTAKYGVPQPVDQPIARYGIPMPVDTITVKYGSPGTSPST